MKKLVAIITLVIVSLFILVGCGAKQVAPKGANKSYGQNGQPFKQADVIGEVDIISGNDITLKIIAMPARPSGDPDANTKTSQSKNPVDRQTQYTGEEQKITISDSTPITTFSRGTDASQKSNLKVSDIKKGDRIQVWYADKEKKTIEKISIMPQRNAPQPSASKAAK